MEGFRFPRIVKRISMETDIATGNLIYKGVKVLDAGFNRHNHESMEAYIILDQNDKNIANELLDILTRDGCFRIDMITGRLII